MWEGGGGAVKRGLVEGKSVGRETKHKYIFFKT